MPPIPLALAIVLLTLAAIHTYWAFGGRWPGNDDVSFVERVLGRTMDMKPPSPAACLGVAGALTVAATLVSLHAIQAFSGWGGQAIRVGLWGAALVFLLRGAAGFVPAFFRYADGTAFQRFNRVYYSPLCLILAAAFFLSLQGPQ